MTIWRLFAVGTLDEKMYQRQLFKSELNAALSSEGANEASATDAAACDLRQSFKSDDLRNLFEYEDSGACLTLHALLDGQPVRVAAMGDEATWIEALPDEALKRAVQEEPLARAGLAYAVDAKVLEELRDETDARHRAAGEAEEAEEAVARGGGGVSAGRRAGYGQGAAGLAGRLRRGETLHSEGEDAASDEEEMDEEDRAFIVDDEDDDEDDSDDGDDGDGDGNDESDEEGGGAGGVSELEMDSDDEEEKIKQARAAKQAQMKKRKRAAPTRRIADSEED